MTQPLEDLRSEYRQRLRHKNLILSSVWMALSSALAIWFVWRIVL